MPPSVLDAALLMHTLVCLASKGDFRADPLEESDRTVACSYYYINQLLSALHISRTVLHLPRLHCTIVISRQRVV